jgi:hypothetical protein
MANSPEELRGFRGSYSVIYREVVKLHGSDPAVIVCLYEGKDSGYYRPRIEQWKVYRALINGVEGFDCGGKHVVLSIRSAVDANDAMRTCLCLYFIDRDFEVLPSNYARVDTYVSDGYSVEFHYFGAEFFARVVQEVLFGNRVLDDLRQTYDSLVADCAKLERRYLEAVRPFNRWAFAVRARTDSARLPFAAFDQGNFVQVDIANQTVAVPQDAAEFELAVPVVPPLREQEWEAADAWLNDAHPARDFRAKQHAWFIINLLSLLCAACRTGSQPFSEKTKVSQRVSMKHFLSDFSAFADTPASLLQFLDGFYEARLGG